MCWKKRYIFADIREKLSNFVYFQMTIKIEPHAMEMGDHSIERYCQLAFKNIKLESTLHIFLLPLALFG